MRLIVEALDALGLALADHGHVWTDRERQLYESAVTSCAGCTGTGSTARAKSARLKPLRKLSHRCARA